MTLAFLKQCSGRGGGREHIIFRGEFIIFFGAFLSVAARPANHTDTQ